LPKNSAVSSRWTLEQDLLGLDHADTFASSHTPRVAPSVARWHGLLGQPSANPRRWIDWRRRRRLGSNWCRRGRRFLSTIVPSDLGLRKRLDRDDS
jgi:hypothetical protein